MPSGNAVAGLMLSRLGRLTGAQRWRDAAERQLAYLSGCARDYPMGYGFTLLTLLEELWPAGELVVCARETPAALLRYLREDPRGGLAVLVKTPENAAALAAIAPFTASYPIPETGARYYLCRNGACRRPVDSPEELI